MASNLEGLRWTSEILKKISMPYPLKENLSTDATFSQIHLAV
jgi:hypothetical protein